MLFDHTKKIWPEPFSAVVNGSKPFEVRTSDEPWNTGETLLLREWNPTTYENLCNAAKVAPYPSRDEIDRHKISADCQAMRDEANAMAYTGQSYACRVTYIVKPGTWGLPSNIIVFGIEPLSAKGATQ